MSHSRRQRHKLLLLSTINLIISTLACYQQLVHCQQQPMSQTTTITTTTTNKQYNPQLQRSSNNNLPLVSGRHHRQSHQPILAQSLPLLRQQQPDLDNVIESTTMPQVSGGRLISPISSQQQQPIIASASQCQLPPTWTGKWYHYSKGLIRVTNTEISDKGVCRDQKGDKYLFEYSGNSKQSGVSCSSSSGTTTGSCLVCLVINERHLNVLQYKESSSQPLPANYHNRTTTNNQIFVDDDHSLLDSICSDITGDTQLESLFRLDTPPIECPITGQYSFNYDSCREPQSSLDSCIDNKQLNFKFSACPDVPGSESKSEVLKCYADWSEGNNYYMIGRLEHASNHQDKGKFRCFVYEKSLDGKFIQMAQSLEESCYGLINANEGPKTLRLTVRPPTAHKCHFPSYIQSLSENWLSVDNSLIYMFNQNSTKYQVKETKEGNVIEEAACLQQFTYPQANPHLHHTRSNSNPPQQQVITNKRYPALVSTYPQADQSFQQAVTTEKLATNDVVYLVQITKNCQTTNYCVRFYRRSNGIVQIDYFINTPGEIQCRNAFIGTPQTQIITSTNLEHQRCPFEGAYTIEAPIESDLTYNPSNIFICPRQSFLTAQCDHPSRLRIHSKCSPAKFSIKNLYCLGSWTTNGLVRLLLADDDRQRYSAWYRDYGTLETQDGAPILMDTPQASALGPMQTTQNAITRSQQLLTAATAPSSGQHSSNSLAPIVDLQIALITPLPIVAKPMQVRLTRRNQCSELRGYTNPGFALNGASAISRSMPSYAPSFTASSGVATLPSGQLLLFLAHYSSSSMLILIVTLLMPSFIVNTFERNVH